MLIDTHTHLNFKAFKDDWQKVVEKATKAGVEKMIVVGTDLASSRKAVDMAEQHESLYASVGIHPHHARGIDNGQGKIDKLLKDLKHLARHKKVVAIGEVGLDYHRYQNTKFEIRNTKQEWEKIKDLQKKLLGMQVGLAKELGKPMILHSREAGGDVLDTIEHFSKKDGKLPRGVWHCFDGSKKYLKKLLQASFYVSFTGNVTYVPDRALVAKEVPLEKLLLETDCPYMKPRPVHLGGVKSASRRTATIRGVVNRDRSMPKDVIIIGQFHAKERGIGLEAVIEQTTINANNLFGW